MKTKGRGEYLKWFCDRVYAVGLLFGELVEKEFLVKRLPAIEAGVFEARSARVKMGYIYGRTKGMQECLEHVDDALCRVERLVRNRPIIVEEAEECRNALIRCARELGALWEQVFYPTIEKQRRLEEPERALLTTPLAYTLNSLHSKFEKRGNNGR